MYEGPLGGYNLLLCSHKTAQSWHAENCSAEMKHCKPFLMSRDGVGGKLGFKTDIQTVRQNRSANEGSTLQHMHLVSVNRAMQ